jgi:hypothetical protein
VLCNRFQVIDMSASTTHCLTCNPFKTKIIMFYIYKFSPYRAVNTLSIIKSKKLTLHREIITVSFQIHTKHFIALYVQNVGFKLLFCVHGVTTGLLEADWLVINDT